MELMEPMQPDSGIETKVSRKKSMFSRPNGKCFIALLFIFTCAQIIYLLIQKMTDSQFEMLMHKFFERNSTR